ncbi:uncharacterized protein RCC_01735 [Ramularia collo-cygni]|uniref:Uncharacterized protein n=1 Tax=Ramularia collo-cygni TaxID=112498 RepID=A0A2D3UXM5_9PEZI|nr:uncharacterized protein RCC_01735 [Ramularia collo-cygni]CZT15896.1 uncharacterized protein RCC_01735 [Ramularia collo-cygni]
MAQVDPGTCPPSSSSYNSTYVTESDWWKKNPTALCGFNAQQQLYTSNLTSCCVQDTVQLYSGCFYYCQPINEDSFGRCVNNILNVTSGFGTICNGKSATEGAASGMLPMSGIAGLWVVGLCVWNAFR